MQEISSQNLPKLYKPSNDSHKGENGRLLVIGGSKLFHASIFWSADVASRMVDLVHFSSPAEENNKLVRRKLKENFWSGIVVSFSDIEEYIGEDDCALIGPGMPRNDGLMQGERPTKEIVDDLLMRHSQKKWVVDGGALQVVDPKLLNQNMIITPHEREWEMLAGPLEKSDEAMEKQILNFSQSHNGVQVLLKGKRDFVCDGKSVWAIKGGNSGMTKGGTGDVLAGLVAALYCKNNAFTAMSIASFVNKKAGEKLAEKVGNYFNASDLVGMVPEILKDL